MRNAVTTATAAVACALLTACTSTPTRTTESIENSFALADENANGIVDVEEYRNRMIVIFMALDEDKDGFLVKSEVPDAREAALSSADTGGDGRISIREYLVFVMPEFWQADIDGDNVLSLTEVLVADKRAEAN